MGLTDRFVAQLWDTLIFGMLSLALIVAGSFATFGSPIGPPVGAIIAGVFYLMRDGYSEGGGFGKNKRGIAVISLGNLEVCNYPRSIVRNAVPLVSAFLLILVLTLLVTPFANDSELQDQELYYQAAREAGLVIVLLVETLSVRYAPGGKRLGDMIAGTQVVYWDEYSKVIARMQQERHSEESYET